MISSSYGVSFSAKQCRNFDLDQDDCLRWLIDDMGFRRFRLMSYWNDHERKPGEFDFAVLDEQLKIIAAAGGEVTLCLGARQPRWPENHWPGWAWELPKSDRTAALLNYIEIVVNRYQSNPSIVSYQLENEALLSVFGELPEVDRERLKAEYTLVKKSDPDRPIIMTTSTSWGIPFRRPIPDIVGFSFYHTLYQNGRYKHSLMYPWFHRLRKLAVRLIHQKPVFIHELQLEPWGLQAIWKMDADEQAKSMDVATISRNLRLAEAINARPIDLWGGEWWYWRHLQGDDSIASAVKENLKRFKK